MFVEIFMDLVIVYYIHNGNSSEEKQFISFRYVKTFSSVLTIFKTAVSSKVFIVGISVFSKTCWKLDFTAIYVISRVPCTAVFLRFCTSGFQY